MSRTSSFPRRAFAVALSFVCLLAGARVAPAQAPAQAPAPEPREEFKNLKVLPKDIDPHELRSMMSGFTRALGVRCNFCHAVQEGQPMTTELLAKDDKPEKEKARVMIAMTRDLNEKYLSTLPDREDPPIRVSCFTCHHGISEPRTLQDVLKTAYETGGLDSTRARYSALRDRYYGRAAYDFGEVPLADVASSVGAKGKTDDANALHALNVEMNPDSKYAQRQYASSTVMVAFSEQGADSGMAAYQRMKQRYGDNAVSLGAINDVGYRLLEAGKKEPALAVFKLNVLEHPDSGDAFDSLGEGYMNVGDKKNAIASYLKSVELDSTNTNAVQKLEEMKVSKKKIEKAKKGK